MADGHPVGCSVQVSPGSPVGGSHGSGGDQSPRHDRFLLIAIIIRIMKKALPANWKVSKDAKETPGMRLRVLQFSHQRMERVTPKDLLRVLMDLQGRMDCNLLPLLRSHIIRHLIFICFLLFPPRLVMILMDSVKLLFLLIVQVVNQGSFSQGTNYGHSLVLFCDLQSQAQHQSPHR